MTQKLRRFIEATVALLVIIRSADSVPQFGQSFSSSSIIDSSGKVLSKSVYTDTTGKKITSGLPQLEIDLLPPFLPNQIPGLDLPVVSPFNKPSIDVEPPLLPVNKQRDLIPTTTIVKTTPKTTTRASTTTKTTTTTTRTTTTTARPITVKTFATQKFTPVASRPAVNNFIPQSNKETGALKSFGDNRSYRVNDFNDGAYRPNGSDDGSYKPNGKDDGSYKIRGDNGIYRPKGNLGHYKHNDAGRYIPDLRGNYRAI